MVATTEHDNLLTVNEAADFLRVKPITLYAWRKRGEGPPYSKVGNRCLYRQTALERYVRRRQVCPNHQQSTTQTEV